jgi:uncharacterized protein YggL (DUF469 family)
MHYTNTHTQTALYKEYKLLFRTNEIRDKNNQCNEEIAKLIKTVIQQNYTVHNQTNCIQTEVSVPVEKTTSATAEHTAFMAGFDLQKET